MYNEEYPDYCSFRGLRPEDLPEAQLHVWDAAPDIDHQLLAGETLWIFNLNGKKYYLPSSKRHFPLSFFQYVTRPRKMKWYVTRTTDSVHVGILIAASPGYTAGPPRCILGLHLRNVLQDIPIRENIAMT